MSKETTQKPEPDEVVRETMTLDDVRHTLQSEEMGYDAPFATLTWRYWLEMQTRAPQCFSRFLRAIEERHVDAALMVAMEMQEMASQLLLEVYASVADTQLTEIKK